MDRKVSGVFRSTEDAAEAIKMLRSEGIPPEDISLYATDMDLENTPNVGRKGGSAEFRAESEPGSASATLTGAFIGVLVGATMGILAGIGAIVIPGAGILMAIGWMAAALACAAIGAAIGGLIGAVIDAAISSDGPEAYTKHLNHGDMLVSTRVEPIQARHIAGIFLRYNAHEVHA